MHLLVIAATNPVTNSTLIVALGVSTLCGWAIPAIVDVVLKARVPTPIKTLLATALAAIAGSASTVVFTPNERWQDYLLAIGMAVANTQAGHRVLQGLGDPVQAKLGDVGIGPSGDPTSPAADQPPPDPAVIDSEDPPADAPAPPGLARSNAPAAPDSLGLAEPPAYLATPAGKATVKRAAAKKAAAPRRRA